MDDEKEVPKKDHEENKEESNASEKEETVGFPKDVDPNKLLGCGG